MKIELKPDQIPQYTGDLAQLEKDHAALKTDAGHIRTTGSDVHSHFQGLSAYYKAPEAEQLFATTKPVQDRADGFADSLETVASALSAYADEIRPLVPKLAELKTKAQNFIRDHKDDEDGDYDEDLIAEHNQIRDDITATVAAFWAAERTCHNKITALWGGTQMVAGDGSDKKNQYGFNAEDMKNAKLPWGDPVEEKHHWYEVGHWVKSFVWDGLIVDGIWGTIKGLGTLVGFGGWDAMGQAWKGLAQLATGLAITSIPGVGTAFWALPEDKLPSWLRDSRTAMKETGKALVAWDEWGKNPGRAAGAVTFNVVTTIFTGGAGGAAAGAGKAGAVAKALSVAGKAGKVIDPMTYVAKGAGAGLSKIGDIAKSIKGIGKIDVPALPADAIKLPEGSLKLPDGTVRLPEGAAVPEGATRLPDGNVRLPDDVPALPENATRLPTGPGEPARYFDGDGNVLDQHGNVLDHADNAPREGSPDVRPGTTADTPRVETPAHAQQPVLVGAGAHVGDNVPGAHLVDQAPGTHLGDQVPGSHLGDHGPGGNAGDHLPGGTAHDLGHGPAASHEPPTGGGHGDGPTGGDHTPGGGDHVPGGGGDHVPGGAGDDLPGGSGSDHLPPPPHGGDLGGLGPAMPDGPRGNLPDGSWAGENGLRLDREANAAADDFMRRSADAEPRITESMQGIAGKVDDGKLIGLEYRLKGEDSLKRKLATDMLEDIGVDHGRVLGDIKDSIRYTMEVPANNYTHGVQQAIHDLQAKGFENVTFKNTWDSAGYKGINSTWRDPVSGQVFELQFHTADSFAAKMDGHALYEKERLPGVTPDELAAIKAEQSDLFGKVPVPHDAGAIRLGGHGPDDLASALGKDADSVGDDLGRAGDDSGGLADDAGDLADDAGDAGDLGDDAADGADAGDTDLPREGGHGGPGGAYWVTEPSEFAGRVYDEIRATPNRVDLPSISQHTGVHESVLRQVKTHLFRAQHDVTVGPNDVRHGLFEPADDIAELWPKAQRGELSEAEMLRFRSLMAHEYVESRLMQAGMPYTQPHPHMWEVDPNDGKYYRRWPETPRDAGAHELAPNERKGGFKHWGSLGLKEPDVVLREDMSNIDDVVKAVAQELRSKGLNLK
ncbi:hypothetical protein [Streptomyces sp. NPDC053542]|uniref:hypothetical protein n=1 Tax=Streptomyces sp. NPDC053542 TaxID=3365710 RepID=UPI0037D353D9